MTDNDEIGKSRGVPSSIHANHNQFDGIVDKTKPMSEESKTVPLPRNPSSNEAPTETLTSGYTPILKYRFIKSGQGSNKPTESVHDGWTRHMENAPSGDRYVIGERLGQGSMGEVYLAKDRDLYHRQVAIKYLKSERQNDEFQQRFRREEQILSALNSTHFPTIYTSGLDGGNPYYIMEYVSGYTLEQLLAFTGNTGSRIFSAIDAAKIMMQVFEGLSELHRSGYMHRDIKPSNIMIDQHNNVRIIDLGNAQSINGANELTQLFGPVATPCYASPEQHSNGILTGKTDVYSAGVIFYSMLTGESPEWNLTNGDRNILLRKGPAAFDSSVPKTLKRICLDALNVNPEQRPGADDMRQALSVFCLKYEYHHGINDAIDGHDLDEALIQSYRKHADGEASSSAKDENTNRMLVFLGDMFYQGKAVVKNYSYALSFYKEADTAQAKLRMAVITANGGFGVWANWESALTFIKDARAKCLYNRSKYTKEFITAVNEYYIWIEQHAQRSDFK